MKTINRMLIRLDCRAVRSWRNACLAVIIALLFACGGEQDGESYYRVQCLGCHGEQGKGGTSVEIDLSSGLPGQAENLAAYIEEFMPAANPERCVGACAVEVAAYIESWRTRLEMGRASYATQCADCHGDTGQGGTSTAIDIFNGLPDGTSNLAVYIDRNMPKTNTGSCKGSCAINVALFIESWTSPPQVDPVAQGKIQYEQFCDDCHGASGEGGSSIALNIVNGMTSGGSELAAFIDASMPTTDTDLCIGECASNIASYINSWQNDSAIALRSNFNLNVIENCAQNQNTQAQTLFTDKFNMEMEGNLDSDLINPLDPQCQPFPLISLYGASDTAPTREISQKTSDFNRVFADIESLGVAFKIEVEDFYPNSELEIIVEVGNGDKLAPAKARAEVSVASDKFNTWLQVIIPFDDMAFSVSEGDLHTASDLDVLASRVADSVSLRVVPGLAMTNSVRVSIKSVLVEWQ